MTMDLRPYPQYKPSGLPWLGEVPAHWDVRRNGRLFAQRNETGFGSLPILEVSLKTGVRVRDMENLKRKQVMTDREKYKRADKGDIAYNMMRMWQGAVGAAPVEGLVSPAYVVARPFAGTDTRYFSYLFRTAAYMAEVDGYSRGIVKDRNRLYWQDFKRMPSCYPPPEEQGTIANFLDANAALVRKYIRNRRRLIEVLSEQKQAIINQAVTRGLDPNVPLKQSSIDWLPRIPNHWVELPLKRLARIDSSGSYGDEPEKGTVAIPVATTAQIRHDGRFVVERMPLRGFSESDADRYTCRNNDILVVKSSGSIFKVVTGKAGIVDEHTLRFVFSNFLLRIVANTSRVAPRFLYSLLTCRLTRERINRMVAGTTYPNLRVDEYASANLPIPPLSEQDQIVEAIRLQTSELDRAVHHAEREIDLIREYRTRLIADVVTGKLDVRHLAPPAGSVVAEESDAIDANFDEELTDDEDAELVEELAETDD